MVTGTRDTVAVEDRSEGVRVVRLDRPERRNAIDAAMLAALGRHVEGAPVVVLSSTDPAIFCAGLDLGLSAPERDAVSDGLYELYEHMVASRSLIVAAVPAAAVGAGAQLALAADLRVLHPDAWLKLPGVEYGLVVGAWGLPSLVGRGRATWICATGEAVDAERALAWGLADLVDHRPEAAAIGLAERLVAAGPEVLAGLKRVVGAASGLTGALAEERRSNRGAWAPPARDPR